jgi:hypothetical protein
VDLVGGAALVLGERLRDGVMTEPRAIGDALTVLATVTGRFAGADTVIVALTRTTSQINAIDLRYRSALDLEPIAAAMAAQYGPGGGISRWGWGNRTTSVSVIGRGGQGRARVVLRDPRLGVMRPL